MSRRIATRLAWVLCGLTACLAVGLNGASLVGELGSKNALRIAYDVLDSVALPVVLLIVAALIVSHQPRNMIGWLLMIPGSAILFVAPLQNYIEQLAPSGPAPTPSLLLIVWFSNWNWLLLIFPLLQIALLFPNGQPPTPRWRWVRVAAIVWAALFVLLVTFAEQVNANTTPDLALDNPIGILSGDTAELLISVWIAGLMLLTILCVTALFTRYRRANEVERNQIKWLLFACAVFLVLYVGGFVSGLNNSTTIGGDMYLVFTALSLLAFPATIGIAILRYRLFDIDIIIRRTLVYSVLTLTLGLIYLGVVVILQALLVPLIGSSDLATVASTLVIAALFFPLRRRIQLVIDRRFYRRKYNAQQVLAAFALTARDETDLNSLTEELTRVVDETMQPEFVGVWIKEPERKR